MQYLTFCLTPAAGTNQVAAHNNPGVQAVAGQRSSNQNSDQFAAGSQGQEGPADFGTGYAYHLDTETHDHGPAGVAAGYGVEVAEPVFSDVSGLAPVYTFRSRGSYNNGRVMFVRTSYNPAEPVMPMYRPAYAPNIPASQNIQTYVHVNDQVKARQ